MLKFLIVDDSRSARARIESVLSDYGKCRMAEDGHQAVQLMESALSAGYYYDMVTMDLEMPNMDGHEAIGKIRALEDRYGVPPENRAKLIVVTSLTDPKTLLRVHYDDNALVYISKPFDTREIEQSLINLGLMRESDDDMPEDFLVC